MKTTLKTSDIKQYQKEYYARNKDKILQKSKLYYLKRIGKNSDFKTRIHVKKGQFMRVWYYDIPAGDYTTEQIAQMAQPVQTKSAVYFAMRRLGVESYRLKKEDVNYNKRNEKIWKWKGGEFYLKIQTE